MLLGVVAATPAAGLVDPGTGTSYVTGTVVVPMTFPIAGGASVADTYLACRSGCSRMHMGQDLFAPKMRPLVAAFDGYVSVLRRDAGSGNYLGITADRGPAKGWTLLYLHVNNDTPGTDDGRGSAAWAFPSGIELGARVLAGQLVGWNGDSGNAESTAPHLHAELRKGVGWSGTVHNLYPSLVKARRLAAPLPSGPHPTGSLLRHPSGALFVRDGVGKRPVSETVLAVNGLRAVDAVPMTAAESLGYPTLPPVAPRDGALVLAPDASTWLVHGGVRSAVDPAQLAGLGLSGAPVLPVSAADLAAVPVVPLPEPAYDELLPLATRADRLALLTGVLVRDPEASQVYRVVAGVGLRPVPGPAFVSHRWSSASVALVDPGSLAGLPLLDAQGLRDGTLVQTTTTPHRVAVVTDGTARRLHDARMLAAYGYSGLPRQLVPGALLDGLPSLPLAS